LSKKRKRIIYIFLKMKIKEKEGTIDIKGGNAFKNSRKKRKTNKINKKKGKIQSGVNYDPLITKRKTLAFCGFTKQIFFAS
jgi:hypothetical protein